MKYLDYNGYIIKVHDYDCFEVKTAGGVTRYAKSMTEAKEYIDNGGILSESLENRALGYAETYGIIEYHITGNNMIYYVSYYGSFEKCTVKAVVDLTTMKEQRDYLKGFYRPYKSKIGGRYQANLG